MASGPIKNLKGPAVSRRISRKAPVDNRKPTIDLPGKKPVTGLKPMPVKGKPKPAPMPIKGGGRKPVPFGRGR